MKRKILTNIDKYLLVELFESGCPIPTIKRLTGIPETTLKEIINVVCGR